MSIISEISDKLHMVLPTIMAYAMPWHEDIFRLVIKIKNKTMSTILPFAIPVTLFVILLGSAALWY